MYMPENVAVQQRRVAFLECHGVDFRFAAAYGNSFAWKGLLALAWLMNRVMARGMHNQAWHKTKRTSRKEDVLHRCIARLSIEQMHWPKGLLRYQVLYLCTR